MGQWVMFSNLRVSYRIYRACELVFLTAAFPKACWTSFPNSQFPIPCFSTAIPPENGSLVGSMPNGPWNRPPHRLLRLNLRLPRLQILDTGQVVSIPIRTSGY